MVNENSNETKLLQTRLKISKIFNTFVDMMQFEDRLSANIFEVINKYIKYDVSGLFFNESDESSRNIFNFSFPKNNITIPLSEKIRDKFFDKMEKYKRINEIQCNLINGDVAEESKINYKNLKTKIILPYTFSDKLAGGIFIGSTKELNKKEKEYLNIIKEELDKIFKLKYIFNEQARHSLIDPMTGLYNRQEFDNTLDLELHKARRYIYNFSLAMIDIDYLGEINKKYGRDFGDFVITELSSLLKKVFRKTDPIYRYNSEKIIVMLPFTPITKSVIPIERLRTAIAGYTFEKGKTKTNLTVSIGLCANYSKMENPEQLLYGLGTALSRAKANGRNKVDIFE